jgi:hypothetical protein
MIVYQLHIHISETVERFRKIIENEPKTSICHLSQHSQQMKV